MASAGAAEFRGGQQVTVSADEVILDDLYATGQTVTVDGRVEGDLVATGGEIRLNGEVTGDLIAAGQAVVINGRVGDDARIAGMVLQLAPAASVGDDLVSAGLSLETKPESVTAGSLLFSGYQALLAGEIGEALTGSMNALELRGGIAGDSEVEVEGDPSVPSFVRFIPTPVPMPAVAGGLTVGDGARLDGEFVYTSSREAQGGGTGSGGLTRRERRAAAGEAGSTTRKPAWLGRVLRLLGLIVLGAFVAWRAPGWLDGLSGEIQANPWKIAGIGLLGMVALPVALFFVLGVVIAVTILLGFLQLGSLSPLVVVLGLVGLGGLVVLFWLTASYIAPLVVGLCTGRWLLTRVASEKASGLVKPLVAGLVLLALLRFVPFLGFLVLLVALIFGWGAVLVSLWGRARRSAPATV